MHIFIYSLWLLVVSSRVTKGYSLGRTAYFPAYGRMEEASYGSEEWQ